MERSIDWIVAALGIMRLGAAYVPIDPAWPDARVLYTLKDSGAAALFAPTVLLDRLQWAGRGIDPTRDASTIAAKPRIDARSIEPESLAYIIYTSGSTGNPKGVEITHANLGHLIEWHVEAFSLTANDRASHLAGLGFDAAVWEIWPALSAGATLCIPDESVRMSPELIQQWMVNSRVTIGFVPTVHALSLIEMKWPSNTSLHTLLTGGDTLTRPPASHLPFTVFNNYGPTECTVVSTSGLVKPDATGTPAIGREIKGSKVYLLNEEGLPVAHGEIGEIYIGGDGVGRGYRNLPDATSKSFLPDPFAQAPGARMYRSGDLGAVRPNGDIEFHGRADRQVKIRGQRIELDEISAVLNQYPTVEFATVMANRSDVGSLYLVGYVLFKENSRSTNASDLHLFLHNYLPSSMVPSTFFQLRELPISANGKVDLALLPSVADLLPAGKEAHDNATNRIQATMLDTVRELLKNPAINLTDNFFLAGGHSLLGMQLIGRLREVYGVDLTLRQLFGGPTVAQLSLVVERKLAQARLATIWKELLKVERCEAEAKFLETGADDGLLEQLQMRIASEFGRYLTRDELAQNQTLAAQAELVFEAVKHESLLPPGVIAVQSCGQDESIFWMHYPCPNLAEALDEERSFLCVSVTERDFATLGDEPTLEDVARTLVPRILAAQGKGPYVIGGFCVGGLLAYETAAQLRAAGYEVSLLVLLDTPRPDFCRRREFRQLMQMPLHLTRRVRGLGIRSALANVLNRASKTVGAETAFARTATERIQDLMEAAGFRYKPKRYEGKVALIMASDVPLDVQPHDHFLPWWRSLVSKANLHSYLIEGDHGDLVDGAAVHKVAEAITSNLEKTGTLAVSASPETSLTERLSSLPAQTSQACEVSGSNG